MNEVANLSRSLDKVQSLRNVQLRHNNPQGSEPGKPETPASQKCGMSLNSMRANWFLNHGSVISPLYHYDVELKQYNRKEDDYIDRSMQDPVETLSEVFRKAMEQYLQNDQPAGAVAHDGRKNAWSPMVLNYAGTELTPGSSHVTARVEHNETTWQVRVKPTIGTARAEGEHASEIEVDSSENYSKLSSDAIRALEGAIHTFAHNQTRRGEGVWGFQNGALYPPPTQNVAEVQPLGGCRVGIRGWHQSLRRCQAGLAIVVDAAFSAFVESGNCAELLARALEIRGGAKELDEKLRDGRGPSWQKMEDAATALKNVGVYCSHFRTADGRRYTRRFSFQGLAEAPVDNKIEDLGKTVEQYFEESYGIRLKQPNIPTVKAGKTACFPAEVVTVTPGQKKKGLKGKQTSEMLKLANRPPGDRVQNTMSMDATTTIFEALNRDETVSRFGIKFGEELARVEARVLPQPRVAFKNNITSEPQELDFSGEWQPAKDGKPMRKGADGVLCVINIENKYRDRELEAFTQALTKQGQERGMNISFIPEREWVSCRSFQENDIEDAISKAKNNLDRHADRNQSRCILVCMAGQNTNVYRGVKFFGDVKYNVMTQCAAQENLIKNAKADYAGNLILKINAKLGGVSHVPQPAEQVPNDDGTHGLSWVLNWPCMLIGVDVNHPEPMMREKSSAVAAVVGSMDTDASQFAAHLMRCVLFGRCIISFRELGGFS